MRFLGTLIFVLCVVLVGYFDIADPFSSVLIMSGSLVVYNIIQIYYLRLTGSRYLWINPIVIGSLLTFGIYCGGFTNFLLIKDSWFLLKEPAKVLTSEPIWIKYFMLLANLASVCMWQGYYSHGGDRIERFFSNNAVYPYAKFYNIEISYYKVFALVILSVFIKFYLFSIGLHGRIVSKEFFEAGIGYKLGSQIRVLGELSLLLVIVTGYQFVVKKENKYRILFFVSFIIELFFSFLFGARGPILMPFVVVGFLYILATNRLYFTQLLVFSIVLFISFTIVNDYKQYSGKKEILAARATNPFDMLSKFSAFNAKAKKKESYAKIVEETILSSTNFMPEGSMAIRHKEIIGLKEKDIDFFAELINVPFNAFVPRFLQTEIHAPAWGLWFKNVVMKYQVKLKWSMAQTSIGNLYFTGGALLVLIGFFLNGMVLKFAYLSLFNGLFGLIFSVGLLYVFCFEEIFASQYIAILRLIFIYPFIFMVIFKKW